MNNSEAVVAATPGGVYELLKDIPGGLSGKHALIIGRSNIVGRPLADLLLNHDCTVTVAHSKTVNLPLLCREADIVIAACGCPRLVKGDWIKPGAAVIDVVLTGWTASWWVTLILTMLKKRPVLSRRFRAGSGR